MKELKVCSEISDGNNDNEGEDDGSGEDLK